MQKYDVVIAGSGLGGLITGLILSKEGYKVCVLEQHHQIGGCLQTFVREGCIFDTGMHYFGSYGEGQILNRYFKYLGIREKLKVTRLGEDAFDIISFKGKDYKYASGFERFIDTLSGYFPAERQGILKYTDKLKEVCNNMNLYTLREFENYELIESNYITQNAWAFIRSCTDNDDLCHLLAGLNGLYAGIPGKTPLYLHALINHFLIDGAWRFVDGSGQLARVLADGIRSNGGDVLTRSKVTRFGFENEELTYVVLANGERVSGKYFVSNIHPATTLTMCDTPKIRKAYRNRITTIENTISSFSLYCVLKEGSLPYMNYNYYYCDADSIWLAGRHRPGATPEGYLLFTPATSKSDRWADSMTVICYMSYDEVKQWEHTTVEKRGPGYVAFKQRKAEELLDIVEKRFPDIRSHIKSRYTSTPLTYRDYTGTIRGSLYGVMKDCNDPVKSYISVRTKVPNLFLTGQNISLHGILGVTIGAVQTSAELCGINYLIKKISEA
ncbi:MAG: NAD(P)/FAD-dependent oxidoreductase [Bacteroidetes bacterium]|nr:NAD(P)/FAD-dependent oxidoreductase [Bacteroidota bacterium]